MSEVVNNPAATAELDPFAIFGTKVEDVVSYEEVEKRDWSKTYLELDPEKGDQTVLVKLCINVFNPKDSLPKRYTYKLPDPENPSRTWNFLSPSTIGHKCPAMSLFFDLNDQSKNPDQTIAAVAAAKKKNLSRKRQRCVAVQIINDLKEPKNNGQFRLLRIQEGGDVDNLIAAKINPSEDERKLGAEPVNVFDPFNSPLLILRCSKGDYGRDFSKSSWAPDNKNHGNLIPEEMDELGNVIKYRPMTEADRNTDATRKNLEWLMAELQKPEVSLKENWMYVEPTEEVLEKARKSLELISTGSYTEKSESPATDDASQPDTAASQLDAAVAEQPVQESTASTTAPSSPQVSSDNDLMAELGL